MNLSKYVKILYISSTILSAIGWGISVIGAIFPSKVCFEILTSMAGENVPYSTPMAYWLVMCSIGFTFIGIQFIFSLFRVFGNQYLVMGSFNIVCAIALIIYGLINGFKMDIQIYDSVFLLTTGFVIILSGWISRMNLRIIKSQISIEIGNKRKT